VNGLRRRAAYAQNFLRHPQTARALVEAAKICSGDRVYDLGAGTGMLTHALLAAGAQVVAVESDENLVQRLRRRFDGRNVTVIACDLNDVAFVAPFKIVANIPYNQTAATMRRLYFSVPHPEMAQLVLQREAADKYAGNGRMSAVSLMLGPWFEMELVRSLAPAEFVPRPRVESVALRIVRVAKPALADSERSQWNSFVRYALGRSKPDAKKTLRNVLSGLQWRLLSRDLGIARGAPLSTLSLQQWISIYRFVRQCAPARKMRLVFRP
jgi:16S rRNA A1518/A1519 N6-dimethyltransferase RsmA/KsgA/DIM1 with predicted DNA glycosylase/AP lyase activity